MGFLRRRKLTGMAGNGRGVVLAAGAAGLMTMVALPALGQSWGWPWEQQPTERREPRQPRTYDQRNDGGYGQSNICLELEQRLATEANRGLLPNANIAQLREEVQKYRNDTARAERELERRDCYEQFFFQRVLRNTQTCVRLARDAESSKRKYQDARTEYERLTGRPRRSYQEDIIRALARNGCGESYRQEARRLNRRNDIFANLFQEDDSYSSRDRNTYRGLSFATYRTLCVRLCDGYYFPISFSTLPNHFSRDSEACQNRCAAPTALYYYQNPGGSIDQMVSAQGGRPYRELDTAFAYRKKYDGNCSCRVGEYHDAASPWSPVPGEGQSGNAATDTRPQRNELSPVR